MSNPRQPADNRTDTPKEPGHGGSEAGVAEEEAEERGVKQVDKAIEPPPPLTEGETKLRSAMSPQEAGRKRRRMKRRRMKKKGTGMEILTGGHR